MSVSQPLGARWWWIVHRAASWWKVLLCAYRWFLRCVFVVVVLREMLDRTSHVARNLWLQYVWAVSLDGYPENVHVKGNPVYSVRLFSISFHYKQQNRPIAANNYIVCLMYLAFFLQQQWPPVAIFCHCLHTRKVFLVTSGAKLTEDQSRCSRQIEVRLQRSQCNKCYYPWTPEGV